MNGGTNVALAIQTASKHMQSSLAAAAPRTMVLLTDGRIDHYQGMQQLEMRSMLVQFTTRHIDHQWVAMETLLLLKGGLITLYVFRCPLLPCHAICDRSGLIKSVCKPHGKCLAGQEAVQVTRDMADEQGSVSIYSFAVGSGVDRCLMFTCCPLWCCPSAIRTLTSAGFAGLNWTE